MARKIRSSRKSKGQIAHNIDKVDEHHLEQMGSEDQEGDMPSKESMIEYIGSVDGATKRDLVHHFSIPTHLRHELRAWLNAAEKTGQLRQERRRYYLKSDLPTVCAVDITGIDDEGDLIACWRPNLDEPVHDSDVQILIPSRYAKSGQIYLQIGDRALIKLPKERSRKLNGDLIEPDRVIVLQILNQNRDRLFLGVVRKGQDGGWRVHSVERGKPRIERLVAGQERGIQQNALVEASLTRNRRGQWEARIEKTIAKDNDLDLLRQISLLEQGIVIPFPHEVLLEADACKPATMKERKDRRKLPFVTIDPSDAMDHDDAIYAQFDDLAEPGVVMRLWVAIADVAAYVAEGSEMDREAQRRGNSTYLPGLVVPMLPPTLSNNLCSLIAGKDRPVLLVVIDYDKDGHVLNTRAERAMIRVLAKLSYEQAQSAMDGGTDHLTKSNMYDVIRSLKKAMSILKKARAHRIPLELDVPERRFVLNSQGHIEDVYIPRHLPSHRLIEESMIQANVAVADILTAAKLPAVFRVHDKPKADRLDQLRQHFNSSGTRLAKNFGETPQQFNQLLTKTNSLPQARVISELVLRSQSQAEYSSKNIGHYGLNLSNYVHFTSPIRRYADLVIHRALLHSLGYKEAQSFQNSRYMETVCRHISATERSSTFAERDTSSRLMAHFLQSKVGQKFKAHIAGVSRFGLYIEFEHSGAQGFINSQTLARERWFHDESTMQIVAEHGHARWQVGQQVEIKLVETEAISGNIVCQMLTKPGYLDKKEVQTLRKRIREKDSHFSHRKTAGKRLSGRDRKQLKYGRARQ